MNTDIFKAQATRLADHLATRHGIKLKHASVLEAIAALHGARDWNTLASGEPGLFGRMRAALQRPGRSPAAAAATMYLGTCTDGQDVVLGDKDLLKHVLVAGERSGGVVANLLTQQLALGGGFLLLDHRGTGALTSMLRQAAATHGRQDDMVEVLAKADNGYVDQVCREMAELYASQAPICAVPGVAASLDGADPSMAKLLQALTQAATGRKKATGCVPFLLVIAGAADTTLGAEMLTAVRTFRAFGIAVVLQVEALDDLAAKGLDSAGLLANTATKLLMRHADRNSELRVSQWLDGAAPNSAPQALRDLRDLGSSDALVLREGQPGWSRVRAHLG